MLFTTSCLVSLQRKLKLFSIADCEAQRNEWDYNWDMKADSNAKGIRQIVLIRHGQYVLGVKGDEQKILTELGRKQADKTGQRIKELLEGHVLYPVKSVHYSTMSRATETYQHIQPYLPPMAAHQCKPCSMIQEGAVMRPEPPSLYWNATDEDFTKEGLRVEAAFRNYIHRSIHTHTKSTSSPVLSLSNESTVSGTGAAAAQVQAVAPMATTSTDADMIRENGNYSDIFVCHGNVIRYFTMRALQLPPEAWLRLAVSNASITVLTVYPSGRVSLSQLGDVGHLPPAMITYN